MHALHYFSVFKYCTGDFYNILRGRLQIALSIVRTYFTCTCASKETFSKDVVQALWLNYFFKYKICWNNCVLKYVFCCKDFWLLFFMISFNKNYFIFYLTCSEQMYVFPIQDFCSKFNWDIELKICFTYWSKSDDNLTLL